MARGDIGKNVARYMRRANLRASNLISIIRKQGVEVSQQRVSNWTQGVNDPSPAMLPVLAKALKVKVDDLLAVPLYDEPEPQGNMVREITRAYGESEVYVPRIQPIKAGSDWTDPFDSDDEMPIPSFMADPLTFCCTVDGDSMATFLLHGDIAVFRQEHSPKIGRIILARNKDGGMTIKKLTHDGVHYQLSPINPSYRPIQFKEWRIEGVMTGFIRDTGGLNTMILHNPRGLYP